MASMRKPIRPAPKVEDAIQKFDSKLQSKKKVPPPRPPPPNFAKMKSKSVYNLNQQFEEGCLIDLSPPHSPKNFVTQRNRVFGGSVSSSFSSSTSSLASSKRSFEYEVVNLDPWKGQTGVTGSNSTFYDRVAVAQPSIPMPTIIRCGQTSKTNGDARSASHNQVRQRNVARTTTTVCDIPPMPKLPPPSPPKEVYEEVVPFAMATANYTPSDTNSQLQQLQLEKGDLVHLLQQVDDEWYFGRLLDQEGIFPASCVDVQVPLTPDEDDVKALYEFVPQMPGDLLLQPGYIIRVIGRHSKDWLYGKVGNITGIFPENFVDKTPKKYMSNS